MGVFVASAAAPGLGVFSACLAFVWFTWLASSRFRFGDNMHLLRGGWIDCRSCLRLERPDFAFWVFGLETCSLRTHNTGCLLWGLFYVFIMYRMYEMVLVLIVISYCGTRMLWVQDVKMCSSIVITL